MALVARDDPTRETSTSANAKQSHLERPLPTPEHPAEGGGIALTLSSASENSEEEEADTRTKRAELAGEGDWLLPRFPIERDFSLPDEHLWRCSGREDSLARSCWPGKPVAEAAPAGVTTPGAGTLADQQATGAADVTGATGPGSTPAPVTTAAVNKDQRAASRWAMDPDRLRNSRARSCKEGVSRGMEPPATAGAGSTLDPELLRSREAQLPGDSA